ncbi:hypothetical protein AOQ84DRAFT_392843 [Glonium stellatum]|uniref:C2H2-type domain-containing protein n=1 Tax=Glonium stellatum TaxID=574774 RepID=A0A8E2EQR8_9PEZI|nr:hypothetical protein AOQ84DRAFT_392843 [Glonium stellatum]
MAEISQLSPVDWQIILTLSKKYPERVLLKACISAYESISKVDDEPSTVDKPVPQPSKRVPKLSPRFFCTFCAENGKSEGNSYGTKSDWKKHLTKFHETGEEFPCVICTESFERHCDLDQHFLRSHPGQSTPLPDEVRVKLPNKDEKQAFGCGFTTCKAVLSTWKEWCEHVAGHIERGNMISEWHYSIVIRNLLRQKAVCGDAKQILTKLCNELKKDRSQLEWSPDGPHNRCLKQKLECCDFGPDHYMFLEKTFRIGFKMSCNSPLESGTSSITPATEHGAPSTYELDDIPMDGFQLPYAALQPGNAPPEYQVDSPSPERAQSDSTIPDVVQRQESNYEASFNTVPQDIPPSYTLDAVAHQRLKPDSQLRHQQQLPSTDIRTGRTVSPPKRPIMGALKKPKLLQKIQNSECVDPNKQAINSSRQWSLGAANNISHRLSEGHNPNFPFADPPQSNYISGSFLATGNVQRYHNGIQIPHSVSTHHGAPIATANLIPAANYVWPQPNALQAQQRVSPGARSASDRLRYRNARAVTPNQNLGGGTARSLH